MEQKKSFIIEVQIGKILLFALLIAIGVPLLLGILLGIPLTSVLSFIGSIAVFQALAAPVGVILDFPSEPVSIMGMTVVLIFGLVVMGIITFVQLGLCHLIAKWLLGATGTFSGVMRPLLLGWFVKVLILIPVVGPLAAGIAWTAVLMLVFEEIDGIGRLQAFLISAGINVFFVVLRFAILR